MSLVCVLVAACGQSAAGTPTASAARVTGSPPAQTLRSCGGTASPARTFSVAPQPPTPSPGTAGSITGSVNYPADVVLPQLVYAINVQGVQYGGASVETVMGQGAYVLKGLVPGTYHVFSVARDLESIGSPACADWGGIYSPAVACGLSVNCTDHSPIAVTVRTGLATTGIDPFDWYETPGDGSFQPPPESIVPVVAHHATGGSFATPLAAANDLAQGRAVALLANAMDACPGNRACVVVGAQVDGAQSAYFVGSAGSNGVILKCGTYVYLTQGQWHGLAWRCRPDHVFPAVGEAGTVVLGMGASPTDCANLRATPGLSGRVVGCIHDGAAVTLDGGPAYVPGANIDGLWWHVAGRGWMVDDFLS
ncbi:MAG TPA: hypothetical protein VFL29_01760 [Candidatus Dormibacteraeota bacterium]|nr:hypothetical protein [Candidatus Dormibacteraeota bacterium]